MDRYNFVVDTRFREFIGRLALVVVEEENRKIIRIEGDRLGAVELTCCKKVRSLNNF